MLYELETALAKVIVISPPPYETLDTFKSRCAVTLSCIPYDKSSGNKVEGTNFSRFVLLSGTITVVVSIGTSYRIGAS